MSIADLHIAVGVDRSDVAGMQIAARPQLLGGRLIVEIALRQPRRARDNFAVAPPIARRVDHVLVDDSELDQRRGETRHCAMTDLFVAAAQMLGLGMAGRQHGAGLRKPVAGEHVDAARHRRAREGRRHRGSAHNHLQSGEVDGGRTGGLEQHLQDRRHAVGERHLLRRDQLQENIGRVAAGKYQFRAAERRRVGATPGVDMKHRRHRHIDVVAIEAALLGRQAVFDQSAERVQDDLAMAEEHAFRPSRRAGGVESRSDGVLVEVGKLIIGRADLDQGFVFGFHRQLDLRQGRSIVHDDECLGRLELVGDSLDEGQKVEVEQDRLGARIVDRVGDIVGGEADVDCLHHGAHHGDCEVALVIAVAVPFHDGDRVAFLDADLRQSAGQPANAFAELPIGAAPEVAINDLLVWNSQ